MIKGYFTQTELINFSLLTKSLDIQSKRLKDLINTHKNSIAVKKMIEGLKYYNGEHIILDFLPAYWLDGNRIEDKLKSNYRLVHQFHKILVDQKSSYIAGNPIVISLEEQEEQELKNNKSKTDTKKFELILMEVLGDNFDDIMNDWIISASNQAVGWIHFYLDEQGELKFIICNSTEIIPIYDTQYQNKLTAVIRYYQVEEINENKNITQLKYRVEYWTETDVTYYAETDGGEFILDNTYATNPSGHFVSYNTIEPKNEIKGSWNKVPFISLQNNSQIKTDLEPIKSLIDAYDKVKSGWINDLNDFQELILVIKGYSGLTSQAQKGLSELAIFLQNLKNNKVISVEEDGGVEALRVDIPVDAKLKFLEITREEIFYFGQGVDVSTDKFGTAPSGVSLKFLYSQLDLKANTLIRKLTKSLTEFMFFICYYIELKEKIKFDYKKIIYTFNKSVIFNEKEKVEMLNQDALLSEQTKLENHPLVKDPIEEQARLEAERKKNIEVNALELFPMNKEEEDTEEEDTEEEDTKKEVA